MARILLQDVTKTFSGDVTAVDRFNLEIRDKEFVIFVGPSGCGKSTTLRMIAGLEEMTSGEITIGDRLVNGVQPRDRDIAMVFQSYALYPHMTVYKNMAFALKMRKVAKEEIDRKVRQTAELLGIGHLLERRPKALSGGERQRVALGRAMVRDPQAFLLDEPLSNLDAKLRTDMRAEIVKLHKELETTFVYVTHDQTEAMTMGDRIVIMNKGHILQVDSPRDIYNRPKNLFVAGFIGSPQMNFITCRVERQGGEYVAVGEGVLLSLTHSAASPEQLAAYLGKEVRIGVRPEHLDIGTGQPGLTISQVAVELVEMLGAEEYIHLKIGDMKMVARVSPNHEVRRGETCSLTVETGKIHVFDAETGEAMYGSPRTEAGDE